MTTTLKDLIAQKEALEQQITEIRVAEKSAAISQILMLIDENGLTQQDIFASTSLVKVRKTSTSKVAAKYRDSETGKEWSGRGLAPKWLAGKNKADYLIT